jgi:branched-chain amino acid aminotransferase
MGVIQGLAQLALPNHQPRGLRTGRPLAVPGFSRRVRYKPPFRLASQAGPRTTAPVGISTSPARLDKWSRAVGSDSLAPMPAPELASVDGSLSETADARIPPGDDGLLRGDGVFEVIRLYRGRPFALGDHLDRLQRSAAAIELPVDRDALEREIPPLLQRFGEEDGQLRIVVTRGGRRILMTEKLPPRGETVSLASVEYSPSVILTGVKSLSYAANMQATRLAQGRGADEAVLVRPDGIVLEAPTSTVFWATADRTLRTPAIEVGVLESITRARVVRALQVEEGGFTLDDLASAEEAFLASTTREVQPVSTIDGRELPECPGPRTREAIEAFGSARDREL